MKKWFILWTAALAIGFAGCTKSQGNVTGATETQAPAVSANTSDKAVAADKAAATDTATTTTEKKDMKTSLTRDELGFQTDTFHTASGKEISFHCIKHGSVRIVYDGVEIEVDPVMELHGRKTDYHAFPDADYILITHEHFDHLDPAAVSALEKADTKIITNAVCAGKLGKGDVMANGDSRDLRSDIHLEAVPAYNTTPGHEKFHPKGRDNGFVLTVDGFRIYIAGDTEDIPEMDAIHDIDIAFLPCNQPYTMTVTQLANAAKRIHPKVVFPYHVSDTPMKDVTAALQGSDIDLRIREY